MKYLVFLSLIVCSSHALAQSSKATKSNELKSKAAANLKTVKLEKRTDSEYEKSGFSFRYKAQDINKHKNYVDVVYEVGRMRINNHGGLENRIADLGSEKDVKKASELVKDANWYDKMLPLVAGRTYALEIKENNHKMIALFHVVKVDEKVIEFVWQPDPEQQWPVDLNRRGAAGCSGMMGSVPR